MFSKIRVNVMCVLPTALVDIIYYILYNLIDYVFEDKG